MPGFDLAAHRAGKPPLGEADCFPVHLGEAKDDLGEPVEERILIPPLRRWPGRAIDLIAEGQIGPAFRAVLSADEYALLEAYEFDVSDFEALFDALAGWSGFRQGRPLSTRPGPGPTRTSS